MGLAAMDHEPVPIRKGGIPIQGWKPGDDVCFVFDDKTGERRSSEELEALIAALTAAANHYGFDLSQHGTRKGFARFFHRYHNPDGTYRDL